MIILLVLVAFTVQDAMVQPRSSVHQLVRQESDSGFDYLKYNPFTENDRDEGVLKLGFAL